MPSCSTGACGTPGPASTPYTRKAIFFGYTFWWIAIRDENDGIWSTDWAGQLSPVQRQLLGGLADTGGTMRRATTRRTLAMRLAGAVESARRHQSAAQAVTLAP
jgi:hypothetical protein